MKSPVDEAGPTRRTAFDLANSPFHIRSHSLQEEVEKYKQMFQAKSHIMYYENFEAGLRHELFKSKRIVVVP